jgi:hypothetical protein
LSKKFNSLYCLLAVLTLATGFLLEGMNRSAGFMDGAAIRKLSEINYFSNLSFGINYTPPSGWTLNAAKQYDNRSVIARFGIASISPELGSSDLSAITLNVTKTHKPLSSSEEGYGSQNNHFDFLLRDERDCNATDQSTKAVNKFNFTSYTVECNSFKYKVYRTVVGDLCITLTYSALTSAYAAKVLGFEKSLVTLVVR